MKYFYRNFSAILLLAYAFSPILFVSTAFAKESVAPAINQAHLVSVAKRITTAYSDLGWFNGTILVAKNGKPIFEASYGLADREDSIPNQLDTKYNLGSIMKHYTAVLVLQKVEDGTLSLDDTLETFRLGFPQNIAGRITVRQLLHHRSGFADIFTADYRENQLAFDTIDKKLTLLKNAPLIAEPDSKFHYSNYGYVVLGAILEKATGQSFESLLKRNIFNKLGLQNSVYPYNTATTNQSLRYTFNHAGEQKLVGVTEHHSPDGGIEATVSDVLAFYRALFYSDRLLSSQQQTIREYFAIDGKHWAAFGGGAGVSTAVELDLENSYQIVVLANSDNLVAELISGRIYSYIKSGSYENIALPPHTYAWKKYKEMPLSSFKADFGAVYKADGYTQFLGRTLNELGMALVNNQQWAEAFDIFNTLVAAYPGAPQVYDSLAFASFQKGDTKQAALTFKKALAIQADFSSDYKADNYGTNSP